VLNEGLLQNRKLAVLGVSFDGADRLAVEAHRRNDAGRAGVTCARLRDPCFGSSS
jgi:hypothetical protein